VCINTFEHSIDIKGILQVFKLSYCVSDQVS